MNVLITGNDGREHTLAQRVTQDPRAVKVFVTPGNVGTVTEVKCENVVIGVLALGQLVDFVTKNVQLTIIDPEMPLVAGVADLFHERGLDIFGPTAGAAQLEGSKVFTKDSSARHQIPTAVYRNFTEAEPALACLREQDAPTVIKADGLVMGKGVIVVTNLDEAEAVMRDMLAGNVFGNAGSRVVIEELFDGKEASFVVMVGSWNVLSMAASQNRKRVDDGDGGSNIGGMGAYSPAPVVTAEVHQRVLGEMIYPIMRGMTEEGNVYTGFLCVGLIIGESGTPKVVRSSCRFDDLETQPIMVRLESSLALLVGVALVRALDKVEATWDPRPTMGVVLATDDYPDDYAKGEVIEGLAEAVALNGKVFHADTALKDDQVVTSRDRALCTTAIDESASAAQQQAYRLAKKIRWNSCFYRKDIGCRAIACEYGES